MSPSQRDHWVSIGLDEHFSTQSAHPILLDGAERVLWRGEDGGLRLWEDRCPHRGMRLSFGFVRGNQLNCLYHGWRFEPGGACTHIPAHPDLTPPESICAATFKLAHFRGHVLAALAPETVLAPPTEAVSSVWRAVRSIFIERPVQEVRDALRREAGWSLTEIDDAPDFFEVGLDGVRLCLALQPIGGGRSAVHASMDRSDRERRLDAARRLVALRTALRGVKEIA